jgi:hypothetical protein
MDYLGVILPVLVACRVVDISRLWKAQVLVDYGVAIAAFRSVSIPDILSLVGSRSHMW